MLLPAPPDPALIAFNRRLAAFHHNLDSSLKQPHHPFDGQSTGSQKHDAHQPQWRAPTVANIPKFRGGRSVGVGPSDGEDVSRWGASRKARDERDRRDRRDQSSHRRTAEGEGHAEGPAVAITFDRGTHSRPQPTRSRPISPPASSRTLANVTTPEDEQDETWSQTPYSRETGTTKVTVRPASPSSSREVSPNPSQPDDQDASSWLPELTSSTSTSIPPFEATPPLVMEGEDSYMDAVPMLSPESFEDERRSRTQQRRSEDKSRKAEKRARRNGRRTLFPVEELEEPVVQGEVWESLFSVEDTETMGEVRREREFARRSRVRIVASRLAIATEEPLLAASEQRSVARNVAQEDDATLPLSGKIANERTRRSTASSTRDAASKWAHFIPYMAYASTPSFSDFCHQQTYSSDRCSIVGPRISVQMSPHGSRCFGPPSQAELLEEVHLYPDHLDASPVSCEADPRAMTIGPDTEDWLDFTPPPRRRSDGDLLRKRVLDWNLVLSGKVTQVRMRGEKEPRVRCGLGVGRGGRRRESGLRWGEIAIDHGI